MRCDDKNVPRGCQVWLFQNVVDNLHSTFCFLTHNLDLLVSILSSSLLSRMFHRIFISLCASLSLQLWTKLWTNSAISIGSPSTRCVTINHNLHSPSAPDTPFVAALSVRLNSFKKVPDELNCSLSVLSFVGHLFCESDRTSPRLTRHARDNFLTKNTLRMWSS